MPQPVLALIVPLGDGGLGFWGGKPPPYPDQGLPGGGQGGSPSQPIYHPGHPDHGHIPYPDQGLPGQGGGSGGSGGHPSHPIHIPGVPDQGLPPGEPVTINPPLPPPPGDLANDLVIAVHAPGQDWVVTSYDIAPDQGQPKPQPQRR